MAIHLFNYGEAIKTPLVARSDFAEKFEKELQKTDSKSREVVQYLLFECNHDQRKNVQKLLNKFLKANILEIDNVYEMYGK